MSVRVGQGIDVHPFATVARPLVLGGVVIAEGPGLEGHSDADALLHALTDALLGAGALGDMGSTFGTDDPRYVAAPSSTFVVEAVRLLREAGYVPTGCDCTVVAQRPKLAPYRGRMVTSVAALLGLAPAAVSVKATTTDGLGFAGRGEGIAAFAVATVARAAAAG